jgi:hypothetical protein
MAKAKAAVKKAAPKKKKESQGIPQAKPEHYFVLLDGRVVRDYKELADIFDDLADHVYHHHVTADRNDFATWINDIFNDIELAQKVRAAQGKHHSQIIIYRHILDRL